MDGADAAAHTRAVPPTGLEISTDRDRLDVDRIHAFLSTEAYWALGRERSVTEQAIANSLCFGAYLDGPQVGFGRVTSDRATFAYVGDVFVLPEARGAGIATHLLRAILEHPDLATVRRFALVTADAQDLYRPLGFAPLEDPTQWLERRRPG